MAQSALVTARHGIVIGRPGRVQNALPVAGAVAWWSPDELDKITLSSGGRVSQMNDKTGNGNNMTQATEANRPMIIKYPSIFGERTGLAFQAAQSLASAVDASDRTQTMFAVFYLWSNSGNPTFIGPDNDGGRQLRLGGGTVEMVKSGVSVLLDSTLTPTTLAPHVVAAKLDTSAIKLWLDGQTAQSNADATTFTAGRVTHLAWKGTPGDPQYLNGVLGEVVIYPTALSDSDVSLVLDYMRTKWGTP